MGKSFGLEFDEKEETKEKKEKRKDRKIILYLFV